MILPPHLDLTSSSSILQQLSVNRRRGKVNISHNGTSNKDILDGALQIFVSHATPTKRTLSKASYQVRILELLYYLDVIELNVEVLVHAFQNALELDVVFELYGDLMVDERLEETTPKESASILSTTANTTCY